jgi:hypothetical protein
MYVIESRPESSMPTRKPSLTEFIEALKNESPETLDVAESTYWRWRAEDLPAIVYKLVEKPHLLLALVGDAKRAARERLEADD